MIRFLRRCLPLVLLLAGGSGLSGCAAVAPAARPAVTQAAGAVHEQVHRTWAFETDGVTFSNEMPAARLNGVRRLGTDWYQLQIVPENQPINPSAWYGFSVQADSPRLLRLRFHYEGGKQRYWPKLSRDGKHWHNAPADAFGKGPNDEYTLQVTAGPVPLLVFAQTPVTAQDYRRWEARLENRVAVDVRVIGHSVDGRPLRMFGLGNPRADQVLLVLGRQHPPETTGAQALMAFVDALAADTAAAQAFRARTRILVVPLMNPDGVVEGHWRHNAAGVDINRDWGTFRQPETRAVRDLLARELAGKGRQLAFAIDFHSTWHDVLYTVKEAPARAKGGVLARWIAAVTRHSGGKMKEKANDAKGTVFKNWIYRHYRAPSVTYEVGDRTPARETRQRGRFAADALMTILLEPAGATAE